MKENENIRPKAAINNNVIKKSTWDVAWPVSVAMTCNKARRFRYATKHYDSHLQHVIINIIEITLDNSNSNGPKWVWHFGFTERAGKKKLGQGGQLQNENCMSTELHVHKTACPQNCMSTELHVDKTACPQNCMSTELRVHKTACPQNKRRQKRRINCVKCK
jgi:hypothetical protein